MSLCLAQAQRYALPVLCVGTAVGTLLVFEHFGLRPPTGMLMAISVAISTWYAERGPALFSLVLAALCMDYFFVEPHGFGINSSELAYYITFLVLITLVWLFSTVRRQVEADLRHAREKLKVEVEERSSLLDLTHDSIFVRDMDFLITYWNRGAEAFYGWKRNDAIGKPCDELLRTTCPQPVGQIRAQLLKTGEWEGELTRTKANGNQVIVASRWSLRRDHQERPLAILEISNDITARKHWEGEIQALNEELAQRSNELEDSNKELEAFAYSVSHDLRAPLRHMAGFAELLRKNAGASLNEKSRRYLSMILEAANRMGNLIDDLLALSRISRVEARESIVDLGQVVQEVVAELRRDATQRNITWKVGSLPACNGDRSLLRLAFVNLLSNAVKFTRTRARAEIEIGSTDQDSADPVLFVRDNGVGFDMKYRHKLFGVFQRLHSSEKFEGTGIGLATVQRIVHRHGGRIWAEGTVNEGATFYFSLPKIIRRVTDEDARAHLAR
jgi:PAS domain S-box-containing protein